MPNISGTLPEASLARIPEEVGHECRVRSRLSAHNLGTGERNNLAFAFAAAFIVVYFLRPEDWIAAWIPFGKVTGILAVAAALVTVAQKRAKIPAPLKLLIVLTVQLCIAGAFGVWRMNSLDAVVRYGKAMLIAVAIVGACSSWERLRAFVRLHLTCTAILAALAISAYNHSGRMSGALAGLGNPNEFATCLATTVPFSLALMMSADRVALKALWAAASVLIVCAVLFTYSRGALLALAVGTGVYLYRLFVRGRRLTVPFAAALLVATIIMFMPANYTSRVNSILHPERDETGSSQERKELLLRTIEITASKPILGVGPGNFIVLSGRWRVAHNTYMQLSSEAGFPALILFLLAMAWVLKLVRNAQSRLEPRSDERLLVTALESSIATLLTGACFADLAFQFYPYFLVAYACSAAALQWSPNRVTEVQQTRVHWNDQLRRHAELPSVSV